MALRSQAPLELLDAALLTTRRGGGARLLWAWTAGLPLALVAIGIYYLERVEGVRGFRFPFALALVGAFLLRSLLLSRLARDYALAIRPSLPVVDPLPPSIDVVLTSLVVGLGLWVWLWPLASMALLSPLAVLSVWPFLSLRGAVAPSWLARASCAQERGFAAFGQAFDDTSGMRGSFLIVELLALFGAIFAFVNAYALLALLLVLGNSLLGFEIAFVTSFLSLDNVFVLLVLSAFVLVAMEPLRAAISAQAFVDARSRRDGADLHAAVDAAIENSRPRARFRQSSVPPPKVAALAVLLGALLATNAARAQPTAAGVDEPPSVEQGTAGDRQVRAHLDEILSRSEFREFAGRDSGWFGDLLERFSRWLRSLGRDEDESNAPRMRDPNALTVSPWALMVIALFALVLIGLYATSQRGRQVRSAARGEEHDPQIAAEPLTLIDDAAAHAARGDMRAALRALYLATLASLDRGRLIEFEPSKTNWQYIRAMPRGQARQLFADFTLIFDRKWYGHEPASAEDYAACRRLAEQLSATTAAPKVSS